LALIGEEKHFQWDSLVPLGDPDATYNTNLAISRPALLVLSVSTPNLPVEISDSNIEANNPSSLRATFSK
jgi:hypothetical protein